MLTTHPTADALLATILADPAADAPRLIYADWLEENGESDRAEFIRLGIEIASLETRAGEGTLVELAGGRYVALRRRERELEWQTALWGADLPLPAVPKNGHCVWRRGFVAEVRTTAALWCGGPCQRCNGDGLSTGPPESRRCPRCSGTGRVGGHGPAISGVQPVESVTLTGIEIEWVDREPGFNGWRCPQPSPWNDGYNRWHPTEESALESECAKALGWARSRAGLPPLRA